MGNWSFSVCAYFGYDVFCCLYQESVENKKFKCPLQLMCICGKRFLLSIPLVLMRLVLWIRLVNLITKWRGKSNLPFELTLLVFIVKLWAGWLHQTGVVKVLSYSHLVLHHLIAMTMDHVMRCYHLSYNTKWVSLSNLRYRHIFLDYASNFLICWMCDCYSFHFLFLYSILFFLIHMRLKNSVMLEQW